MLLRIAAINTSYWPDWTRRCYRAGMAAETLKSNSRGLFGHYDTGGFYDEMFAAPGVPRPHYAKLFRTLAEMAPE
jgi:hypothetical protein